MKNELDLSIRELDILYLISKEYSNAKIAELLLLSKYTVDTHRRNLYAKFNIHTTAGLMRRAHELKILPMKESKELSHILSKKK